jgi:hypothetical protein
MVVSRRKGKYLIKMFTFNPELKLARSVARILSSFEHRDYDDLYGNR